MEVLEKSICFGKGPFSLRQALEPLLRKRYRPVRTGVFPPIKSEVVYNGIHDSLANFENALTRAFWRKNHSAYIRSFFDKKKIFRGRNFKRSIEKI